MYCEQCGAKNEEGTKFCTSCGANMGGNGGIQLNNNNKFSDKFNMKLIKKIVIGVAAVTVVAVVGMLGYNFISDNFGSGNAGYENHPIVYTKDGFLLMRNQDKKESYPLTDNTSGYYGNGDYGYEGYTSMVQMSTDGKLIFFADDINNGEFKLYYRKTNQKVPRGDGADEKGIRLASGVTNYVAAPDGSFVIYQKGDRLYISNLKDERSISSDVTYFNLSNDLQKVMFRKDEGDLYLCGLGENDTPEKVDAEVGSIVSDIGEYKTIYYRKDDSLFYKEYGKDKVKVTSDINDCFRVGDTYFVTKKVEVEKGFNELFNDDCAAADADMTSPSYSDFRVPDEDGYMTTDYDAYNAAREKYNEKRERDEVREYYSEYPQKITTYTLYKVVGTEVQEIDNGLLEGYLSSRIIKKQASNDSKITMSTITDYSDAKNKINDLQGNIELNVSILMEDGSMVAIPDYDSEHITNTQISPDNKYFYCVEDPGSNYKGTLNRYTISSNGLTSKEKIYDDTSGYTLIDDVVIIHSGNNELGIYDGKYTHLSDSSNWQYNYGNGVLYYYDQYSSNREVGNLMRYKNGKTEQVDIDVHDFTIRGDENCYYIKDYSSNSERGELYQKKGGKPKHIDSDVKYIVY